MKTSFFKYHGAGNDFVLMDLSPPCDLPALARFVCDRRHGIGADGLLLLIPTDVADYGMRIFNADGTEASMCGNGIRCLAGHIFGQRPELLEVAIETRHAVLRCRRVENEIAVGLGVPILLHWPIELEGMRLYVVNTGVLHAVLFVEHLDAVCVSETGRQIRFHPRFAPEGVNVSFASVTGEDKVALRTYERGVEGETQACGTGAAATAFVAVKVRGLTSPIGVLTRVSDGSYHQSMRFLFHGDAIEMVGGFKEVFEGVINLAIVEKLMRSEHAKI